MHARARAPRPWTTSLQRPAAKILVAGGLTLAGWLLGAALSGSTASAADRPACPEAPVVSTVDHAVKPLWHARHRKSHHETGAATCTVQPKADSAEPPPADEPQADETTKDSSADGEPTATTPDGDPAVEPVASESSSTEEPAATTSDNSAAAETAAPAKPTTKATTKAISEDSSEAPKATSSSGNLLGSLVGGTLKAVSGATTKDTADEPAAPAKTTSSGGDLLGGLLGGVLDVVGGTLSTVTGTVGAVTDTLSHTVLAPLTQPLTGNPGGPVLLPLDDILGPVLGGSNSGGVIAVVPGVTAAVVTQAPATVAETVVPAAVPVPTTADPQQAARVGVTRFVVLQHAESLPVVHERPRDSGTHATGGGGDSTPGLPGGGGTTAPSAPAPTAAPGHDGPGGARHAFAVHTDDVTTTQLKLIGTSRDHEVDGAGREAALPTTSPD